MVDNTESAPEINAEFKKVISDLRRDILGTFPELQGKLHDDIMNLENHESMSNIFDYCKKIFPERFFDILYQNNEIWEKEDINTCFLPGLDFAVLMKDDGVSDSTKETLWKYLQIILLSITSSLNTGESFGDTAKLFEAINEDEFKSKLEETVEQLHNMFDGMKETAEGEDGEKINLDDLPNPEELHSHITGMLDGKLGRLAREIAEETAQNLGVDMEGAEDVGDVFKKLFKNPGKLMNLVKDVGGKLDEKIKSGEIKESELLEEATEIMAKMKDMPGMPGMDNIQDLLKKMGMSGGQMKNFNQGAFKSHMERQMKLAKMKERIKKKQSNTKIKSWSDGTTMDKTSLAEAQKLADEAAAKLIAELEADEGKVEKKKKKKKKKRKNKNKKVADDKSDNSSV